MKYARWLIYAMLTTTSLRGCVDLYKAATGSAPDFKSNVMLGLLGLIILLISVGLWLKLLAREAPFHELYE